MKVLKFLLIFILVLIVIVIGSVTIFLSKFDVNQYKPQIIAQLTKTINRTVNLDNIKLSFSFSDGVSLNLTNLSIADDAQFSKESFFTVQEVSCRVDAQSLIKERKIYVTGVEVKSPKLVLIRNKNGQLNVQQIKITKPEGLAGTKEGILHFQRIVSKDGRFDLKSAEAAGTNFPALLVHEILVTGANVIYRDQSFKPEMVIPVSNLDLKLENFSLTEPFNFTTDASLWSREKNVHLNGLAQLDLATQTSYLNNLDFSLNLNDFVLKEIRDSLSFVPDLNRIEMFRGRLEGKVKEAAFSPKGILDLGVTGNLNKGELKVKELASSVEDISLPFEISVKDIHINGATATLGGGKIAFNGVIRDYLAKQEFELKVTTENVDLAKVLSQKDQPVQVEGKVNADVRAQGMNLNPQMLHSTTGKSHIEAKEFRLTNINLLQVVLSQISMLPGLDQKLEENLPEKYKEILKRKDTPFASFVTETHIEKGALVIDQVSAETDVFSLAAQGTVDLNMNADLSAAILIPADLSDSMVQSENQLVYLLDDSKRIMIPVKIMGQFPKVSFMPDVDFLAQKIIIQRGTQELDKVLDKIFKKEETPETQGSSTEGSTSSQGDAAQPGSPEAGQQTSEEKPVERQLIEGLLNSILKKQ